MNKINIPLDIPEKCLPLLQPASFKVVYGGRAAAKSHTVARILLFRATEKKCLILCVREFQRNIRDSVHRLLAEIIAASPHLTRIWEVQEKVIRNRINGSEFVFYGIRYNPSEIKGFENADYCWVEEAENTSDRSWEVLIPTIRKPGSEIWVTFNTRSPNDPTYQRFIAHPREDTIVIKMTFHDNPFVSEKSLKDMRHDRERDHEAYLNIWEGEFDTRHSGYVYARYVEQARSSGRIIPLSYEPGHPVHVAWDLGKRHSTCLWFAQIIGLQPRIIDYYENSGEDLVHYAKKVRSKPYDCLHYLPHDAEHNRLGMQGSIREQLESLGIVAEPPGPAPSESAGMELAKKLIQKAWFCSINTKEGLHGLSNLRFKYNEERSRFSDTVYDDWAKDPADAFRYLAVALDGKTGIDLTHGQFRSDAPLPTDTSWVV